MNVGYILLFVLKIPLARLRGRTPRMAKWIAKYPHFSSHPPRGSLDARFSITDILNRAQDQRAVAQKERTSLWKAVKRMHGAQHELLAMRSEPGTWIWSARRTRRQRLTKKQSRVAQLSKSNVQKTTTQEENFLEHLSGIG